MKKLRAGDTVTILPEFQDPGDDTFTWIVVGEEEKGRVDIRPEGTGLDIPPTYTLRTDQVRLLKAATQNS